MAENKPSLASLEQRLASLDKRPPLHLWNPDLSGDIDIRIDRRGRWFHEGSEIKRHPLVCLFASILRREEDGEYYLVTPVEKWRIHVEDLPLLIVDMNRVNGDSGVLWLAKTNTHLEFPVSAQYPLSVETTPEGEPQPQLQLDHGLAARIERAVFYRLIEAADEAQGQLWLESAGDRFSLGRLDG